MEEVLKVVASGKHINKAATDHNVPHATLKDKTSGRVQHKANSGLPRYLNEDEEKDFAKVLKETSSVGSRKDVRKIAELYAKKKSVLRKSKITQGWWKQFVRRQHDLSQRQYSTYVVRWMLLMKIIPLAIILLCYGTAQL